MMKRRWQVAIGGLVLAFGMLLTAHWFWFPDQPHPPIWLAALCIAAGLATLLPVQFTLLVNTAREFVPMWRAAPGDRRSGEERRVADLPFEGPDRRKSPDVVPLGDDV